MGPCVVPIRNHVGFSAITAGPFSRSRSPAITDERRVREICVIIYVIPFQLGFMYLGGACNNYYYYLPDNSNLCEKKMSLNF